METNTNFINLKDAEYLVIEGGGGRGNAYLGCIKALEEYIKNHLNEFPAMQKAVKPSVVTEGGSLFKGIAGTSAGAITALTLALGFNSEEIANESNGTNGFKYSDFFKYDKPGCANYRGVHIHSDNDKVEIPKNYEDYDSNKIEKILKEMMSQTEVGYFLEGYVHDKFEDVEKAKARYKAYYGFKGKINNEEIGKKVFEQVKPKKIYTKINHKGGTYKLYAQSKEFQVVNHYITRILLFLAIKSRLIYRIPGLSRKDPIVKKILSKPQYYIFNILYNRGFFLGNKAREYFTDLVRRGLNKNFANHPIVKYAYENEIDLGATTFKVFKAITGVDLRIISSNITYGERIRFSAEDTPNFPVAESISMSMCIPGAFKPYYVEVDEEVKEKSKVKAGFYGDGGMLDNFSIDIFSPEYAKNTLGLMVTDGPSPDECCYHPKFTHKDYYERIGIKNRINKYYEYIIGYNKSNNYDLPDIVGSEKCKEPGETRKGFTIFNYLGWIINMFLTYSTKRRFEDLDLKSKNVIEVFSHNVSMFNFSPESDYEEDLFEFIVDEAYLKTKEKLKL
jgi:predicted acylesterase/phospholipase RssA